MKPLQLEMSAFGSYGGQVQIDFEDFKSGLFLITGDTGAGKTTIFDAMMYALYGRTSGGERSGMMMRSQYASPKEKTYVTFSFLYASEKYSITRNPEYLIQKELKNGTIKEQKVAQNVELTMPDGMVYPEKKSGTDAKIVEIIGLDAGQFLQMGMIAQGDFLKLIYARTDERKSIFSRIFGTGLYAVIQDKMRQYSGKLDQEIEENKRAMEQEYARAIAIEAEGVEVEEIENADGRSKTAEMKESLLMLWLENGKGKEKRLKKEVKEWREKNKVLQTQIVTAKEAEKVFAAYEREEQQRQKLEAQKPQVMQWQSDLEKAEKADKVKLAEQEFQKTQKEAETNKQLIAQIVSWQEVQQQKVEAGHALHQWIVGKNKEISYDFLHLLFEQLQKSGKELEVKKTLWIKSAQEAKQKQETYDKMYQMFLHEQAGILAAKLTENTPCPVCGSREHPKKAKAHEKAPSQQEVEGFKKIRDAAEKEREALEKAFELAKADLDAKRENTKTEGQKLLGEAFTADENGYRQLQQAMHVLEEALSKEMLRMKQSEEIVAAANSILARDKKLPHAKRVTFWNQCITQVEEAQKNLIAQMEQKSGQKEALEKNGKQLQMETRTAEESYRKLLKTYGFADEKEYRSITLTPQKKEQLNQKIQEYQECRMKNEGQLQAWKEQMEGKERTDYHSMEETYKESRRQEEICDKALQKIHVSNASNRTVQEEIKKYENRKNALEAEDILAKSLFRTANGRLPQSEKMDLETYVQREYFRQIIAQANKRFLRMTNEQFMLQLKEENTGKGKNEGLDLQVYCLTTANVRDIKTLSGGESFLAALAMALGLSDMVKRRAGGIHLDMMFIDEGFGSLDDGARKKAIEVLDELAGENRLIGIISHVTELKEQMERKLVVTRDEKGSKVSWELS